MNSRRFNRSEFIESLCDFNFFIFFDSVRYPKGKIYWDEITKTWEFDTSQEYRDFFIKNSDFHSPMLIECWFEKYYRRELEVSLNEFIKDFDVLSLTSRPYLECLDFLNQELLKLQSIVGQFYTEQFFDEYNPNAPYELLWHRKVYYNLIDEENEKGFNERKDDRFLNDQISFHIRCKKENLEFLIEFLNKKIQWVEFKYRDDSLDNLKSLEDYFEKVTSINSNISKTIRNKYVSFDSDRLKYSDENFDYMRGVLLKNGVIEDIDYRDFRRLFKNEILIRPIVWIGRDPLLHYFIKTLVEKKVIIEHNNVWKITSVWFVIKEKDTNSIRRIDPKRIARLKRPNKGVDFKKFDKVFSFIKP